MSDEPKDGADLVASRVAEIQNFDPGLGAYNFGALGEAVKFADLMSRAGEVLPAHLRGKPAMCLAVTMRAVHWGFDPFALGLETYQAKDGGVIGFQAKVFTAVLRKHGVPLRYRYEGKTTWLDKPAMSARGNEVAKRQAVGDRKCIAYAVIDGETLEYASPTLDEITVKNSPMWHNDPDQQLAYYSGRGFARRYRSDLMMGAYSNDEVESMAMRDVTPTPKENGFSRLVQGARAAAQAETPAETASTETQAEEGMSEDAQEAYLAGMSAGRSEEAKRSDMPDMQSPATAKAWLEGFEAARAEMAS